MTKKLMSLVLLVLLVGITSNAFGELVAQWRFDEGEGDIAYDSSGLGHDVELFGGPAWVPGMYGFALDLDGNNDYGRTDNLDGLPVGTAPGSLTGWGRTDSVASGWAWIVSYGNSGTNLARFLGRNGTTFYIGGYGNDISVAGFWDIGEWHHVAMTFDGTTAIAYGDGVEVAREDKAWNTGQVTCMLGQQISPAGEMWDGSIDDVRIYDHVLTVQELQIVITNKYIEASQPKPINNETDVLRDTALSWEPGLNATAHDVYFGTVFNDVNDASRANPMGVLLSQGQTGTTYDLDGLLEWGQTYYWRIDSVDTSAGLNIVKGYIWSFTTEPFASVIENVAVTSNTTSTGMQGPERIIDGSGLNADDQHTINTDDMWAGVPNPDEPSYLEFEFDHTYKLYEMLVWNYNMQFEFVLGYGLKDVTIEYSEDGTDWMTLGDFEFAQATGSNTYAANTVVPFDGVAAKYVRLTINSNFGGTTTIYGLSELRFTAIPVQAKYPDPIDGADRVPLDKTFSWRPGREASSHEIYLGTDPNALALVATTTQPSYNPSDLTLNTTHYWQIVEVNESEAITSWTGDLWTFSTAEYVLIDGFEDYTDDVDAEGTIWQTWIDALDDPSNGGSVVGYGQSPFAEQTIVHSGSQSMPLSFDNSSAGSFSETDRTLDTAQDWTAHNIKSLSLWFYGSADNSGRLYVKINNTKVTYDGDADDIAKAQWQPWNIDLSTIGGNLSSVRTLSLGVEGVGQGLVFIDDLRLYAETPQYVTPAEPGSSGLVAYYALNGNANDSSGHGYNGTATGGYLYVTGVNGQGIDFDGASGYVNITNASNWPAGAEPRSMTAWLMTREVGTGARFAVSYGTGSPGQAMFLGMIDSTLYGGGYNDDITVQNFFAANEWYHTGLTYDGTTARLYANGLEVGSAEKSWNLVLNRAHIGLQVNDLSEFWDGAVDDVYIYGRVLSPEEVAFLAGKTAPVHIPF